MKEEERIKNKDQREKIKEKSVALSPSTALRINFAEVNKEIKNKEKSVALSPSTALPPKAVPASALAFASAGRRTGRINFAEVNKDFISLLIQ